MGDLMDGKWKALVNAIVHDGYDCNLVRIGLVCEKCKWPYMYVQAHEEMDIEGSEFERFSVYVTACPECKHVELNVIGTYNIDEISWALQHVVNGIQKYFKQLREMQDYVTTE